jgi:hypothetical protein
MSDKPLRQKAAKSDRRMRSTPIAELSFQFYNKEVSKKIGSVNEKEKLFWTASCREETSHAKGICTKNGRKFRQIHTGR